MDHRTDLPAPALWRTAAFIAASVATVELLVLLVVGIWLFGKFFSDEVSKATDPAKVAQVAVERRLQAQGRLPDTSKEAATADAKPLLTRGETSVLVLNGNGVSGAASELADRIRRTPLPHRRHRERHPHGLPALDRHVPARLQARGPAARA